MRVQFVGRMGLTRVPECGATRGAGVVGFVYFASRCRPHVPEISDFFALAYGNIHYVSVLNIGRFSEFF